VTAPLGVTAVLVALGFSLLGSPVGAQQTGLLQVIGGDASAYPRVTLTVAVPRTLVGTGLRAESFSLSEAGERRPVTVERLPDEGLQVVLAVDTSGSMRGEPLAAARGAVVEFVRQMPPGTQTAVLGFSSQRRVVAGFAADPEVPATAIEALQAGGETALYDAVVHAVGLFDGMPGGRRTIVVLSDGGDTVSQTSLAAVRDLVAASGVALTVVELQTPDTDPVALAELAGASGNHVVPASDPTALADAFDRVADGLVNQYAVTYSSAAHGLTEVRLSLSQDGPEAETVHVLQLPEPVAASPNEAPPSPEAASAIHVVSVDTSAYPLVEVRVVAPRALALSQLEAQAFRLTESGKVRDLEVRRVGGTDLEIVLALDTSGSMRGQPIVEAVRAGQAFLDTLPDGTRAAMLTFDSKPSVVSPFTSDLGSIRARLGQVLPRGETALYDAVLTATGLFQHGTAARSVVLLSDGGDTVSTANLEEAAGALARSGAGVHVISLLTPETDLIAMDRLTSPSGGLVASATDPEALATLFTEVATDVTNQYVLRFETLSRGLVEIEVGVAAEGVSAATTKAVDLPPPPAVQSFMGSRAGLVLGGTLVYLSLALTILILLAPRAPQVRLAAGGLARRASPAHAGLPAVSELAEWASRKADQALRRGGRDRSVNALLEAAGVNLRPGEFVVLALCGSAVGASIGVIVAGPFTALVLATSGAFLFRVGLGVLASRRREAFSSQLGDTLQLLASSLRAGYSVMQGVDVVAREAPSPTREEFQRLVVENRLGRDLHSTLEAMAKRVGSEDFRWVVQAMEIHREVGGNLADVLDAVAGTIRERNQIRGQIKALSAEGRISAWILLALPLVLAAAIHVIHPGYLPMFGESPMGMVLLVASGVFMVIGAFWLRRIVRLVF
jgi:tight adherence protein B